MQNKFFYYESYMFSENDKSAARATYSNVSGSIYYDELIDAVCLTLIGFVESANYRALLNKSIELLAQCKTCKLLSDTSQMEVIAIEDQDWSENDWAKRAIAAGLKYNAIVLSMDILSKLSIEYITNHAKVVNVKYFDNVADAKTWLKML